ncbi:MAG: mechanosensitive ion channel [Pseudomonadales bacterium]|nr:mechanosensitive ion channel [Pseudomonadales bacterium]
MENELQQVAAVYDLVAEFLVNYSFQLVGAILILILGVVVARKVGNLVLALLSRKNIDITLSRFVASGVRILIVGMVAIIALGKLGISITPFVATIGALSLGAGLALQGLLSNYGAGVSIIVARPFVVGDTIMVQGVSGVVREVHLAYTLLSNEDETIITIPNRHIIGEIIHNSHEDTVVELKVGIAYHCDPQLAINVISAELAGIEGVSGTRAAQVGIDNFADSSIEIGVRFWAKTLLLHQTRYRANMAIHRALAAHNIEIPFPQRDVHLLTQAQQA